MKRGSMGPWAVYPTLGLLFLVMVNSGCAPLPEEMQQVEGYHQAAYKQYLESRPPAGFIPSGVPEVDCLRRPIAHYYQETIKILDRYIKAIDNCPSYYQFEEMTFGKSPEEKRRIFASLPPEDRKAILEYRRSKQAMYDEINREVLSLIPRMLQVYQQFETAWNNTPTLNRLAFTANTGNIQGFMNTLFTAGRAIRLCKLSKRQYEYTMQTLYWIKVEHEIMENFSKLQ